MLDDDFSNVSTRLCLSPFRSTFIFSYFEALWKTTFSQSIHDCSWHKFRVVNTLELFILCQFSGYHQWLYRRHVPLGFIYTYKTRVRSVQSLALSEKSPSKDNSRLSNAGWGSSMMKRRLCLSRFRSTFIFSCLEAMWKATSSECIHDCPGHNLHP